MTVWRGFEFTGEKGGKGGSEGEFSPLPRQPDMPMTEGEWKRAAFICEEQPEKAWYWLGEMHRRNPDWHPYAVQRLGYTNEQARELLLEAALRRTR